MKKIAVKEYWGSLGNGAKLDVSITRYLKRSFGISLDFGISSFGKHTLHCVNGDLKYDRYYLSSYYYVSFGPVIRMKSNKSCIFLSALIGLYQPYGVKYRYEYVITDELWNAYDTTISGYTTELSYRSAFGFSSKIGFEYYLNPKASIVFELVPTFFNISLPVSFDMTRKSIDEEIPNSFTNIAPKIGFRIKI